MARIINADKDNDRSLERQSRAGRRKGRSKGEAPQRFHSHPGPSPQSCGFPALSFWPAGAQSFIQACELWCPPDDRQLWCPHITGRAKHLQTPPTTPKERVCQPTRVPEPGTGKPRKERAPRAAPQVPKSSRTLEAQALSARWLGEGGGPDSRPEGIAEW